MIKQNRFDRNFNRKPRSGRNGIVRRLCRDSRGSVGGEYAFLIAFIAIVAAVGFVVVGDSMTTNFSVLGDRVETASTEMPNPLGGGGSGGGSSSGGSSGGGSNSGGGNNGGGNNGGGNNGGGNNGGGNNGGGNNGGGNNGGGNGQ